MCSVILVFKIKAVCKTWTWGLGCGKGNVENSHRSGNFCLLMSSMKDLTKSTGTKAACLFFLWASLKFLSTKTPARFDWPCPHTDLYTATLRETTDSANILTHTKPIDKVKKTVAWPLAEKRVFPQVLFTLKAIEQSLIYFVSSMFSALILVVFFSPNCSEAVLRILTASMWTGCCWMHAVVCRIFSKGWQQDWYQIQPLLFKYTVNSIRSVRG